MNKSEHICTLTAGQEINADFLPLDELNIVEASKIVPKKDTVKVDSVDINPNAPKEAREKLQEIIQKFIGAMEQKPWGTTMFEHKIRTRDEFVNRCNAYVYGPKENEFQQRTIKEMLEKGIVRKSREANVSPVVVAHHPQTKKMRFCVNYQKLNAVTIRESHAMPRVWDTLQKLAGSEWFSKLDMLSGFWQVPIAEESVSKTAFITNEGMKKDVDIICNSCPECLLNKDEKRKAKMTSVVATRPMNILGIDTVGPFTKARSHKYRYILIVVDYFSKWTELFPLETTDAVTIINILIKRIFARFGNPSLIISDGAKTFTESSEWKEMLTRYNIGHNFSSAYHQQANGQVEAMVKHVKALLRIKADNDVEKWPGTMEFVMAARNSSKSDSTQHSAYYSLFGYEPRITIESEQRM
jgi:hypothetical protein